MLQIIPFFTFIQFSILYAKPIQIMRPLANAFFTITRLDWEKQAALPSMPLTLTPFYIMLIFIILYIVIVIVWCVTVRPPGNQES